MTEAKDILGPVPDISKTGWENSITTVNDVKKPLEATFFRSKHAKLGVEVTYGQGSEGYDQWNIKEPNGGGSVIIPYLYINGELYVGANRQNRTKSGGLVTEVPRGFSLPYETNIETAKREFEEETGVARPLVERVEPLGGKPINPNSTFFQANARKKEGVKFFGVRIEPNEVEIRRSSQDPKRRVYRFTPELQEEIKEVNEKIKPEGIRFFHASLLSQTSDGFTLQAIARLATK